MNERDYLRLKKKFTDEYAQKLHALELIWLESSGGKRPPKEVDDSKKPAMAGRGFLAAAIAEFSKEWKEPDFSSKDLEDWLLSRKGHRANRTTVTHKLLRMVNDGKLAIAEKGSGKRASRYTLVVDRGFSGAPASVVVDGSDTDDLVQQLKAALQEQYYDPMEFKQDVLINEFGVQKVRELSAEQIQGLIERFKVPRPEVVPEPL